MGEGLGCTYYWISVFLGEKGGNMEINGIFELGYIINYGLIAR